jgi:hypothetical protein
MIRKVPLSPFSPRRGKVKKPAIFTTVLFLALWAARPTWADSPRDALLRLVPSDVGFCLLLEDLRGHSQALLNSPFLQQLQKSPWASKIVKAQETQQLDLLDQYLLQYLHVRADQLRDEILGDALVLAYRPGPPGKPSHEQGLLLLHARNPNLLKELVERVNRLQKDAGDLKELEQRRHDGQVYYHRTDTKGDGYYYLNGPLLAVASQPGILHQALNLERQSAAAESPLAHEFRLLGVDKPLAALWLNPRAFEPHLRHNASSATGAQAVALKTLLRYWQCLDGVAFSLVVQKDLELSLALRARVEGLPAAAQRLLHSAVEHSELWRAFPEPTLVAAAGRIDLDALADVLSEFLPEDARKNLRAMVEGSLGVVFGKQIWRNLLPNVGPDGGFYVAAPVAKTRAWFPRVLAAVRVQPGKADSRTDLTLLNALTSLAALVVFQQNGGKPGALRMESMLQDGVEVKYLVHEVKFPAGFRPAFALKKGYLVLASSPDEVQRFLPDGSRTTALGDENNILRVSFREIIRYVRERREALAAVAAAKHEISHDEAEQRLTSLESFFQFVDRVEITQRTKAGCAILTLRLRMAQPLR